MCVVCVGVVCVYVCVLFLLRLLFALRDIFDSFPQADLLQPTRFKLERPLDSPIEA